jgi:hypothetical protein
LAKSNSDLAQSCAFKFLREPFILVKRAKHARLFRGVNMHFCPAKSLPTLALLVVTAGFSQTFTDTPAVVANADGRLEIFARGSDGAAWHNWQGSRGGAWVGWYSLGGWIAASPTAAINADGRLDVFVLGGGGIVYHNYQVSPGGGWSGWISLGGPVNTTPNVVRNADGRLELFAQGTDGAGWHARQMIPGDYWSGWDSFGGWIAGSPAAIQNTDGRLEIFALGGGNTVFHNWQASPGGNWVGWNSLGGSVASNPTAQVNNDGRLEVFAQGTDGAGWHIYQLSVGGAWSSWASFGGGIIGSPSVGLDGDGSVEIFALGGGNLIYNNVQFSGWPGWNYLGGLLTNTPSVSPNFDGRLEIFATGMDGTMWHNWQLSAGYTSSWSGWSPISQPSDTGTLNGAYASALITDDENDANYAAANTRCPRQPPWLSASIAWPCGARVNIGITGYEKKGLKWAAKAIKNWNQKLFSYYSSGYGLVPVQLYISAGGPQTLWVHPSPDLGVDPNQPDLRRRAITGSWQYDASVRLRGAETQVTALMTYDVTLTNTFAHELGHTFGLNDCDRCGIVTNLPNMYRVTGCTVMDSSEPAPPGSTGSDQAAMNFPEGLAGPIDQDLAVIDMHLTDYQFCGMAENAPPPQVPSCTNGQAVGFLDNSTSSQYTCGSPCDGCNSACNNFAPQHCSGGGGGGGGGGCANLCGNICLDGTFCEYDGSIPQCEFLSQGFSPVCPFSPIVIDALGEGFHLTSFSKGVKFRVLPGQSLSQMSWTDQRWRNGWLALDRNANGKIDDFTELFGNVTPQPHVSDPNGYAALAMFDEPMNGGNGNGAIDPRDSVYDHLRL